MTITREDIDKAFAILRAWKSRADSAGKKDAARDTEHIIRVLEALYAHK